MKKFTLIISLFALVVLLTSCGSTSNLSKYDLDSKTFYFEENVTSPETSVRIYTSNEHHKDGNIFTDMVEIAKTIGTSVITAETQKKVQNSVNNTQIAKTIADGMENTLNKYLRIKPTRTLDDEAKFIVTTSLEECSLVSNNYGVYMQAKANVQIVDRATGGIVWENNETRSSQLRYSENTKIKTKSVTGFIQMAELAMLSDEEISTAIYGATKEIGKQMGETFREDFYKARK